MSNRIYVGNLPFTATTESIREAFSESGEVTDVHVVMDRATGRSRGFAFVTMATEEQAKAAIERFDGQNFDGRPLRVNEAEARPPRREGGGGFGGGGGGGFGGGGGGGRGGYGGGGGGRGGYGGGGGGGGRGGYGGGGGGRGGYGDDRGGGGGGYGDDRGGYGGRRGGRGDR